ncbi:hypothetical protein GWI33_017811 [Rhynchophorus ferrugineus]|uniref:LIM zinc-binding domain-containing protein n=1 Tax=Rhynchophorus ferrugineus TaxID=354439 RepID=A0A834M233_RHYFE|nr:hypothetical protein GWI33_017811 [Rhynchophorus ferrugineus]
MCCRPISDRFLLRIMDVSYHEQCVQCCACGDRLHHTCFVRDSKLYCRIDYDRGRRIEITRRLKEIRRGFLRSRSNAVEVSIGKGSKDLITSPSSGLEDKRPPTKNN